MSKTVQWTAEQQQAIRARERKILVAAAAGSGKTAVLVERIIQRLLDPVRPLDLDRLLVVTFTEAAAAEMRTRIGQALAQALNQDPANHHLKRQLALLHKAQISTLHSFCLSVVRRYFYELGLDPAAQVLSERESLLLEQEVLEQVLEERYTGGSETFFRLAEMYGSQREGLLAEEILRLARFLRAQPFPDRWLEHALAFYEEETLKPLEEMPWYPELTGTIALKVEGALDVYRQAMALAALPKGPKAYLDNLRKEYAGLEDLLAALEKGLAWSVLQEKYLAATKYASLKGIKKTDQVDEQIKERVKELRDEAKDTMGELKKYFLRGPEAYRQELLAVAPIVRELASLLRDVMAAYRQAKIRRGQLDFSDLEHYCLQLLCRVDDTGQVRPSAVARELAQQYREIMVDEYQDTNDLQDLILRVLTGEDTGDGALPSLFMVGDVKQSIYRFRMANPGLFLAKYLAYARQEGSPQRKILLSANFRSRREVVDGVNWIFRRIMTAKTGELDYDQEAELIYRAHYPEPPAGIPLVAGPVEFHVINGSRSEEGEGAAEEVELTALEKEAQLIAYRIRQLVGLEGEPPGHVWDKSINDYRPVRFKDIVILLRSARDKANVLLDVLHRYNIPAYAELGTGYFQATEVSIMLSLLQIIDNPDQDIPLAAVLRSPLVGLNTNELAKVRLHRPWGSFWGALRDYMAGTPDGEPARKLEGFLTNLDRWRTLARQGPLSRLIWQIYEETAFLDYAGAMPGGRQRKANLYALYDRAREFDAFSRHGLFRFLRFIEKLQEDNEDLGLAGAYGESDDVVRIMSIHKSKGLEFPVVIVANLGGRFNFKDLDRTPLVHQDFGFGPMHCDLELRVKYPTMAYWGIRAALQKAMLAEELRVLYVALTRAREKLILVGAGREPEELKERWQEKGRAGGLLPLPVLAEARSYLDWLGPALSAPHHLPPGLFQVYYWDTPAGHPLPVPGSENKLAGLPWDRIRKLEPLEPAAGDKEAEAGLAGRLTWRYPFLLSAGKAAKLSATELKRRLQVQDEAAQPVIPRATITARPRFLQETQALTGAELGTAMHLVMQHLDFHAVDTKELINRQIEKMVEEEFLTPEQAQAVGWKRFLDFFQSPLGQKLAAAPPEKVKREVAFTLGIPAREIYPDLGEGETERVIVQGIIDCLLVEEDGIILIDYKNDQVREDDLSRVVAGYRHQLELYARAVGEIYGRPVKEKYLYFFQLGQAIPV
ncbi:MAG TPA: helicase-exonuclease AddAB subunit AddA [Clostridia bacterium]|nr:helicase-exonuclease AddAB subunit AddA [Clostridia bacterium]